MERNRWLHCKVLMLIWVHITLSSCIYDSMEKTITIRTDISVMDTKGYTEDRINDVSLIVFDQDGLADRCLYSEEGNCTFEINLISGRRYFFHAFVNFGYHVFADHIDEVKELTFHLNKADKILESAPMYGHTEGITASEDMTVIVSLKRMASQILVDIDRSRLSDDVLMEVTGIRIGNSPRQVRVTEKSKVNKTSECFEYGHSLSSDDIMPLNTEDSNGISGTVCLTMLENMQGDIVDRPIKEDSDKIFDHHDERCKLCSYLEIDLNYLSQSHFNADGPLRYRLYLGDGKDNLDIERNCIYNIRLCPEDNGISEDSWRVDKTHIHEFGPSKFQYFPESYIQGDIGDTLHLWCEFYPPHTPLDIGLEELEYDKSQGIYDYIIDEDGHGVRLILTGPGTGIVYMEAGEPINDAAMWIIEVNLPEQETESIDSSQCEIREQTSGLPECRQRPDFHHHLPPQDQDRSPSQLSVSHPDYAQPQQLNDP